MNTHVQFYVNVGKCKDLMREIPMENDKVKKYLSTLEEKKAELLKRVSALAMDKTRQKGAISADFEDQAQDVENDEVVDSLEGLELDQINQIDQAIQRIGNGKFGICVNCGEAIPESRLKAMPSSPTCIQCIN